MKILTVKKKIITAKEKFWQQNKYTYSKRKIFTSKKISHSKVTIFAAKEKLSRQKENSHKDKKVVRILLSRQDANRIKIKKQQC